MLCWTWKILLILTAVYTCNGSSDVNVTNVVQQMLSGYDPQLRPNYNGKSVVVGVTMYFLRFYDLCEKDMEVTMELYFRQIWTDNRLMFAPHVGNMQLSHHDIWTPDTFFPSSKKSWHNKVMRQNIFTRIQPTGNILHSARITTTVDCPMKFALYPMDTQVCKLELESFGSSTKDIQYEFAKGSGSVGISPGTIITSRLRLIGHRIVVSDVYLSTGNYSRLSVEFVFQRSLGRYFLEVYFPSALVVVLSWLGFWLGTNKSARICLGLITTFILIQLMLHINTDVPKLNTIMAIDVYLLTCLIMTGLTLIEFGLVYFLHSEDFHDHKLSDSELTKKFHSVVCNLDKYSKIGFPLLFIAFNLLYWIITLTMSNVNINGVVEFQE
uniref:Neurotransmitter-gated ion-channel ligand-binding domain-containing protein n=1 Tax=Strigamia maritima TaxID=126957 RepID=T1IP44_STRMM